MTDAKSQYSTPNPRLNEVRSWRPEQCNGFGNDDYARDSVSMKSGLGDRNNGDGDVLALRDGVVSMKSGLGDRNNPTRVSVGGINNLASQ